MPAPLGKEEEEEEDKEGRFGRSGMRNFCLSELMSGALGLGRRPPPPPIAAFMPTLPPKPATLTDEP
jgi:hypothetical protein